MSHESGFRQGGRDFSHKRESFGKKQSRGAKRYEDRMAKRFHEHEKDTAEHPQPEEEQTES